MPAQNKDLPFRFTVEGAFRITGRGTVIVGVIDQGTVPIGDHLDLVQPSGADTTATLRCQCLDASPMSVTGRDPALETPVGILIGPDIEPDAIRPGAKLQAAADNGAE